MQNNKVLGILIAVMVVILAGVVSISIFKEFEFNNVKDNKTTESEISDVEVLEVTSKDVVDIASSFNIVLMLDDENLLSLLFSEEDSVKVASLTDSQKFYLALKYYMIKNNKSNLSISSCDLNEYYDLSKNDLKGLLFKDSSYLSNINTLKPIRVGEYSYFIQSYDIKLCGSIFGVEGPINDGTELEVVAAYKKDSKLYIDVKFIHYVLNSEKSTDEVFYYDTYDSFTNNNNVIESFSEGTNSSFMPDYSKYRTYELVFEIDNENYYFESISRKK